MTRKVFKSKCSIISREEKISWKLSVKKGQISLIIFDLFTDLIIHQEEIGFRLFRSKINCRKKELWMRSELNLSKNNFK